MSEFLYVVKIAINILNQVNRRSFLKSCPHSHISRSCLGLKPTAKHFNLAHQHYLMIARSILFADTSRADPLTYSQSGQCGQRQLAKPVGLPLPSSFDITSSPKKRRRPPHETTDRRLSSVAWTRVLLHMPYNSQFCHSLLRLHRASTHRKTSKHGCCHRDRSDSVSTTSHRPAYATHFAPRTSHAI
jgi:hypothetical protein